MKILAIKTITDVTALHICEDDNVIATDTWESGRELATGLLGRLASLTNDAGLTMPDLAGIIIYGGPGSFTSLRIGITTANALAYSLSIPIVKVSGEGWLQDGVAKLRAGENDKITLPDYGAEPHITAQKK